MTLMALGTNAGLDLGRGWVGAARRQVAEGGAGAGESFSRGPSTVQLLLPRVRAAVVCAVSVLQRAMNVLPVSQCRLLAAEVPWSNPAECHLVALWKLHQNDFSTPDPNHPNIETDQHPSFAPSQPASIERFCRELNAQSESRCCVLFDVPRLSNTFFLSFSQLEIVLPILPYPLS